MSFSVSFLTTLIDLMRGCRVTTSPFNVIAVLQKRERIHYNSLYFNVESKYAFGNIDVVFCNNEGYEIPPFDYKIA